MVTRHLQLYKRVVLDKNTYLRYSNSINIEQPTTKVAHFLYRPIMHIPLIIYSVFEGTMLNIYNSR